MNTLVIVGVAVWLFVMLVLFFALGNYMAKGGDKDIVTLMIMITFWPVALFASAVVWPFWKAYQMGRKCQTTKRIKRGRAGDR